MVTGDSGRQSLSKHEHYFDLVDLYAARAIRARTVLAADALPLTVTPIGRSSRKQGMRRFAPISLYKSRRAKLLAVATALLIGLSIVAQTALAEQTYRVQDGDTVHSVADRFSVDALDVVEANDLEDVAYLYPGQELKIPGTADSDAGTGYIIGTYTVAYGDTVASIAWDLHVSAEDLLAVNDLTDDDYIFSGDVLYVPESLASKDETIDALAELDSDEISDQIDTADASSSVASAVADGSLPTSASVWVPNYYQQRNLSCEYASAFIATSAFGNGVPESAFWDWIPVTANPHWGFRGDIDGWWGNTTDYGIYAEPLVPVLAAYGYGAEVFYGGNDASTLMQQIAWGRPVVVWLAMWGNTAEYYSDEGEYTLFAGEHVMTAYGYDEYGVYLSDPASGSNVFFDWGTFLWMWSTIDGMAMAVYPL